MAVTLSDIGSIASLLGLLWTYIQVQRVKKVADATRQASEETKDSVQRMLSVAQVAKYCESIHLIIDEITANELRLALHLMRELKAAMIELQTVPYLQHNGYSETLSTHVKNMGVHIASLQKSLHDSGSRLKKDKITQDLDELSSVMTEIQAKIKHSA